MEEQGFSTVTLNMTPDFNREIGFPRMAAIEYPYGRTIGQAGDREGQRSVLIEALNILDKAQSPGQVFHLPFKWPEDPKDTKWHPPEISPIVKLFLDQIKKAGSEARK